MFGYIKPYQPELKIGEFEQYRGLYCSLCRRLGKRYGPSAQMTLSYDMTFLLVFYLALSDDCVGFHKGRCPYNPLKKRMCCCDTPLLDRCADASVLLVYYKTLDTIADDSFFKRLLARLALIPAKRHRRKAKAYESEMDAAVAAYIAEQTAVEKAKSPSSDAAAEPTAKLLSFLCASVAHDEEEREVLRRFGYCLGRWIYLMDAADDLEKDRKSGNYNPFLEGHRDEKPEELLAACRERARLSLNVSVAECQAAYDRLTIRRFDGIVRNILEMGLAQVQRTVLSGDPKKKREDKR